MSAEPLPKLNVIHAPLEWRPDTPVADAAEAYIEGSGRVGSNKTAVQYRAIARRFAEFISAGHGHGATVASLTDENVVRYVRWRGEHVAPATVRGEVAKLLAMWRWVARKGVAVHPELQAPRRSYRIPRAMTRKQLRTLWRAAQRTKGFVGGVPGRIYFPALLGLLWDTGERFGAVHALDPSDIDLMGRTVYYRAENRKGGLQDARKRFSRRTARALRRLLEASPRMVFASVSRPNFYHQWHRLRKEAGLPEDVMPHAIRRSHATYLKLNGGDARQSLGHSSDEVTNRHYIDPTIASDRQPCDLLPRFDGWRRWLMPWSE